MVAQSCEKATTSQSFYDGYLECVKIFMPVLFYCLLSILK